MKDGIHNITIQEYHENRTHVSSTRIKRAKKSIAHYFYPFTEENKPHFDFGNAFEAALVDKEEFQRTVAIKQVEAWTSQVLQKRPDIKSVKNTTEYKEKEAEFLAENEGKYIINDSGDHSFEVIESMLESCYKDKLIKALTVGSEYQPSYFWTCHQTGLKMKSRPDVVRKTKQGKNIMVDVKTGPDFSPREFRNYLVKYDLPIQAIMQIEGFESCTGEKLDEYYWLGVEKKEPYLSQLYRFGEDDIEVIKSDFNILKSHIVEAESKQKVVGYGERGFDPFGRLTADIPPYYSTYIVE